ncbi:sensor domain-containing diguanylate cyclase [Vibrio cyclitrophicus]|uniref:sensor domain-containing diguanylate cyclase n=3 Tax=Vibrio cyclitrophicus TaxID=47951 RepID=UPI0002F4D8CC|nr:sensor domain-containing diguanylate cyclase [Vibrio cyclitrophicus]OEE85037.1 diguanylate cyclase [Vibrio cyclitrophicus FF160]OEF27511.1 diguanylate cyclase [Vibrio cyclitrophicus 1F97]OEF33294.1 diguanylate cyclase [Vibrio cyclitrophicus 1F53]OEF46414.1 diguanylate cyclase [Vibrio cyclitrophicus 1F273]OEF66692.1 diguanylate cyclase [Vibrio cyclitrophicus 1F175]
MLEKVNLRKLILVLCVFTAMVTLVNVFYSLYQVQRDIIINMTLESNRVYAKKMAEMTDVFLDSAMTQLQYSAKNLSDSTNDKRALAEETKRLKNQTKLFNSVVVVNSDGIITAVSPETVKVKGIKLTNENSLQPLKGQAPLVTDPFVSPAGNYLISLSYPIFSNQKEHLGYISGTIYLEAENILGKLLNEHSYEDGSYLYVVDRHGTLIYHPNESRIGEIITNNRAINTVSKGESGSLDIVNSLGTQMLAGFAPVSQAGWGVVAQKSKQSTLLMVNQQMREVFITMLPVGGLTLMFIWFFSSFISKPLKQLAMAVKGTDSNSSTVNNIKQVHSWYFEASQLKSSFIKAFGIAFETIDTLHTASLTDSMTGLLNRRGLDKAVDQLQHQAIPFSVLALDIDFFKSVNDNFGHDTGDDLLKSFAQLMKEQFRDQDLLFRSGGEEFIIFLLNSDIQDAFKFAERLRKKIELYEFSNVGEVTVSIGVAFWGDEEQLIRVTLKEADTALYRAKINGRNRTELFKER